MSMLEEMIVYELSSINRNIFLKSGISITNSIYDGISDLCHLNPPLSTYDILFLNTALKNGSLCATNDSKLHSECKKQGLCVLWVMDLVVTLKQKKLISLNSARKFLELYKLKNNRFPQNLYDTYFKQIHNSNK